MSTQIAFYFYGKTDQHATTNSLKTLPNILHQLRKILKQISTLPKLWQTKCNWRILCLFCFSLASLCVFLSWNYMFISKTRNTQKTRKQETHKKPYKLVMFFMAWEMYKYSFTIWLSHYYQLWLLRDHIQFLFSY